MEQTNPVLKGLAIGVLCCVVAVLLWSKFITAAWISQVQGEGEELEPVTVEEMNGRGRQPMYEPQYQPPPPPVYRGRRREPVADGCPECNGYTMYKGRGERGFIITGPDGRDITQEMVFYRNRDFRRGRQRGGY